LGGRRRYSCRIASSVDRRRAFLLFEAAFFVNAFAAPFSHFAARLCFWHTP
jgi:hypothetical protein